MNAKPAADYLTSLLNATEVRVFHERENYAKLNVFHKGDASQGYCDMMSQYVLEDGRLWFVGTGAARPARRARKR